MLGVVNSAVSTRRMIQAAALGMEGGGDGENSDSSSGEAAPKAAAGAAKAPGPESAGDPLRSRRFTSKNLAAALSGSTEPPRMATLSTVLQAAAGVSSRHLVSDAPEASAGAPRPLSGRTPVAAARQRLGRIQEDTDGAGVEQGSMGLSLPDTEELSGAGWSILRPRGAATNKRLRSLSVTKANFELELTASKIQTAWRERRERWKRRRRTWRHGVR